MSWRSLSITQLEIWLASHKQVQRKYVLWSFSMWYNMPIKILETFLPNLFYAYAQSWYCFNYFIGGFHLSICLWMIESGLSMFDFIFLHYLLYKLGCKLSTLICDNFPWDTKMGKNIIEMKWNYIIFSRKMKCFSFYPFCNIISANRMCLFCRCGGLIGPTKSKAHFSKGSMSTWGCRGISSEGTGFPIFW